MKKYIFIFILLLFVAFSMFFNYKSEIEPLEIIYIILAGLLSYFIPEIISFVKKIIKEENEKCPYKREILSEKQDFILKKVIKELEQDNENIKDKFIIESEKIMPTVLLIKEDVKISEVFSSIIDNNEENMNFISILKNNCKQKLWNNKTFRLHSMDLERKKLILSESNYYKTLSTCDIHYYNLMNINLNMIYGRGKEYRNWIKKLKEIFINKNFTPISASLGCSTLLVTQRIIQQKTFELLSSYIIQFFKNWPEILDM